MANRKTGSRFFRTSLSGLSRLNDLIIDSVLSLSDEVVSYEYLKRVFLSKYCSQDTAPPVVRRQRAINKWLATERNNEATNDRILTTPADYNILPRVRFDDFVDKVRQIIASIIGEVPPFESLIGDFSGGASTSRTRASSHPALKFLGKADVTPAAMDIFLDLLDDMPLWRQQREETESYLNLVPGNVLFTVPKNHDIDRCACKEPDLNMFMQKGLGDYIAKCLRRVGIDLNDQSKNRDLAREGSINGLLATIDLSSASDSVSSGLVELLLPDIWFSLLDSIRSPVTIIDGEEHTNAMFSSMGNGFTFELESLIFYSIARASAYFMGDKGYQRVRR